MDPHPTPEPATDTAHRTRSAEPAATNVPAPTREAPGPGAPPEAPGPRPDGVPAPPGAVWHGPFVPPVPPSPPRSRVRRLLAPVGAVAGVVAAFAYVGTVDPNEPGHYPVCPLLRFTGVYCPGCGGLRSAHAFAHGDLPAALGSNALAVVGYGVFAVVAVLWLVRAYRGVPTRLSVPPNWWWGIGAVLALFTLVRNLPFGSALAP
ncbi:DUF2752 domain-containing protein [Streptomyces sp. NPDC088915]|uniref:DUF2752 domain-containing protein n=1 Tax=Streptomyces sp. NPDC088915 TaxID=3365912 RepID=UPI003829DB66